jgi:hypothetical protein
MTLKKKPVVDYYSPNKTLARRVSSKKMVQQKKLQTQMEAMEDLSLRKANASPLR